MNLRAYHDAQVKARLAYLNDQQLAPKEIQRIVATYADKLAAAVVDASGPDGLMQRSEWPGLQERVRIAAAWLAEEIRALLATKVERAATAALDGQRRAAKVYLVHVAAAVGEQRLASLLGPDAMGYLTGSVREAAMPAERILTPKVPAVLRVILGGGMGEVSQVMRREIFAARARDGKNLSARIWDFSQTTQEQILGVVNSGVVQGKSAANLAKELRQYLLDPFQGKSIVTPSEYAKGVSSVHTNTLRLARTETQMAYHQLHVNQSLTAPYVLGIRWNLSASHPKEDVCDGLAAGGPNGGGVYPKDEVPEVPHPNCLCYLTDELMSPEAFIAYLEAA
ncbi:MAG: hypothetical protein ACYC9Q_15065 [Bacillota bacterium]